MKKFTQIICTCLILLLLTNGPAFADIDVSEGIAGALLGDLETGEILYQYNVNEQLAMASVSKLMTYLLMMDAATEGKISLDDQVTISGHADATEGSSFGVIAGEAIKLSTLANGMLVVSGNDAATAIAEYVGGSEDNFVRMMNERASEMGLISAFFINPHGLPINDEDDGQNHMSISDIYKLVRHILTTYPQILEITGQDELIVPERNYRKASTNPLFGLVDGIDGLKTGYTDKAGQCLVSTLPVSAGRGKDFRLISIVMGAKTHEDRNESSIELLKYGMENFSFQELIKTESPIDHVYITTAKDIGTDVYAAENYNKLIKNKDVVKTEIVYSENVSAPLKPGDKIGAIKIYVNDEEVKEIDAIVKEEVKKAGIFVRAVRFIKDLFGL